MDFHQSILRQPNKKITIKDYSSGRYSANGGYLACPARFERATYALEAGKMIKNNNLHDSISLAKSGVLYAPRILVLGGTDYMVRGIRRLGVGLTDTKSGEPTASLGKPFLLCLSSPRTGKFIKHKDRQNHCILAWFCTLAILMGLSVNQVGDAISSGAKNYAARYLHEQLKSAVGLV